MDELYGQDETAKFSQRATAHCVCMVYICVYVVDCNGVKVKKRKCQRCELKEW